MWNILKQWHNEVCKAERVRKKKHEKQRSRQDFMKGPFWYARNLFDQPWSGTLAATKQELEEHLLKTYSDEHRLQDLEDIDGVTLSSAPAEEFDCQPP